MPQLSPHNLLWIILTLYILFSLLIISMRLNSLVVKTGPSSTSLWPTMHYMYL